MEIDYNKLEKFGITNNGKKKQFCPKCHENRTDKRDKSLAVDWKKSVLLILKKGNAKECSNYCTIALISHASKVMLKILQASPQQYVNRELPDVQAGFRKGRGTTD